MRRVQHLTPREHAQAYCYGFGKAHCRRAGDVAHNAGHVRFPIAPAGGYKCKRYGSHPMVVSLRIYTTNFINPSLDYFKLPTAFHTAYYQNKERARVGEKHGKRGER